MPQVRSGICLILLGLAAVTVWAGPEPAGPGTAPAAATTPTAAALTLDEAWDLAQRHGPDYLQAVEQERQARAQWWQALLACGPTGTLQAGYVLENKPMTMSLDLGGPTPSEIQMATSYYSGQVSLTQPLFTGGKLWSALQLSGLKAESAADSLQLARTRLYADVVDRFNQVVLAERTLAVTTSSLDSLERHLAVVQARYREGAASNFDLLRSRVQVANLKPMVLRLRTALALARRSLALLIGLEGGSAPAVTGTLAAAAETWPALDELQASAQRQRRDLKNLDRAQRMAGIGHWLAASGNLPNLALTGGWTYFDYQDQGFPPTGAGLQHSWQVGLGLSWTFWDNLAAIPKAEEAASRVRAADLGRQALADGIRLEVEASYLTLTTAREALATQQQAVDLAQQSARLAETQYANGQVTNLEVLDAQIALNQAQLNLLQAQFDQILAGVRLHQAVGDEL